MFLLPKWLVRSFWFRMRFFAALINCCSLFHFCLYISGSSAYFFFCPSFYKVHPYSWAFIFVSVHFPTTGSLFLLFPLLNMKFSCHLTLFGLVLHLILWLFFWFPFPLHCFHEFFHSFQLSLLKPIFSHLHLFFLSSIFISTTHRNSALYGLEKSISSISDTLRVNTRSSLAGSSPSFSLSSAEPLTFRHSFPSPFTFLVASVVPSSSSLFFFQLRSPMITHIVSDIWVFFVSSAMISSIPLLTEHSCLDILLFGGEL